MTKDKATDIQDQDLDQAQGGVIINGDHMTAGDLLSVQTEPMDVVEMGGANPFNTADTFSSGEDTIVPPSGFGSFG